MRVHAKSTQSPVPISGSPKISSYKNSRESFYKQFYFSISDHFKITFPPQKSERHFY